METQKTVNLLNDSDNESSKFTLMTKIMDNMTEEMKIIQPLYLKQKSLK